MTNLTANEYRVISVVLPFVLNGLHDKIRLKICHKAEWNGWDSSCSMANLLQLMGYLQQATPKIGRTPRMRKIRSLLQNPDPPHPSQSSGKAEKELHPPSLLNLLKDRG